MVTDPEIKNYHISNEGDFIVMGSDGLFDFMKDSDISFFIRKKLKEDGSKDIALKVAEHVKKVSGSDSDDITCIIIFF